MENVRTRRLVAAGVAFLVAAADLIEKLIDRDAFHQERSLGAVAVMTLVAAGLLLLVPRIDSLPVLLAAGVGAGGAMGNVVSAFAWSAGVPDPLVLGDVAFNLADVCAFGGAGLLLTSAAVYALRNRERLRQPL
jgi:lipoprotein signal peptidase